MIVPLVGDFHTFDDDDLAFAIGHVTERIGLRFFSHSLLSIPATATTSPTAECLHCGTPFRPTPLQQDYRCKADFYFLGRGLALPDPEY